MSIIEKTMSVKTNKTLSQFFLKDRAGLRKIAAALGDITDELVLEIGGGHGELSQFLTQAKQLLIYEIDLRLAAALRQRFLAWPQVEIRQEDFLLAPLETFNHQYQLIGNIPYHLSGLILRKILNQQNYPKRAVLTLQKEYSERLLGLPHPNFLSYWLRIFAEPKRVITLKRTSFRPSPKVDSLTIQLDFFPQPLVAQPEEFAVFLKRLFLQPKRKLKHKVPALPESLKSLRPHQLTFAEIINIYQTQFAQTR